MTVKVPHWEQPDFEIAMALSLCGSVIACVKWEARLFLLILLYLLALPPVATTLETSVTVRQDAAQPGIVVLDDLKIQLHGSNDLGWSYGFLVNISIDNQVLASSSRVSIYSGPSQGGFDDFAEGFPASGKLGLGGFQLDNFTFIAARFFVRIPKLKLGMKALDTIRVRRNQEIPGLGFLAALWRQGLIEVMGFGMYYDAYNINSSQITLEAVDTEKYDRPIVTYEWSSRNEVGGLLTRRFSSSVGDTVVFSSTNQRTFVVPSEPNIRIPKVYRDYILESINGHLDSDEIPYVDCRAAENTKFSLEFEFDRINITLTAKDLIGRVSKANKTQCRVFVESSEDGRIIYDGISASLYLGIPFLRVAYVWLDYQNSPTSLAKARRRVTTTNFVKVDKGGIISALQKQKVASSEARRLSVLDMAPLLAAIGVCLGIFVFWAISISKKQKRDILPPAGELDRLEQQETAAAHGKSEVSGSQDCVQELQGDYDHPVELYGQPVPTGSGECVPDRHA
ncbi:hypothetical protein TWF703_003193 [Orbilia oligospora]|uniref:Peptidase A1 domain-containing protein n=1 Tax=Orbilia oligospora TaxID=2813651 RepID=A0A7C8P135_ORBOL|nr:hypothetical protein TWF703_003193 [Orbilia oligospora]